MDPKYMNIGKITICLIEECAELTMAICKAERFGVGNFHPDKSKVTNAAQIRKEMDDVKFRMAQIDDWMVKEELKSPQSTSKSQDKRIRAQKGLAI